MTKAEQLKKEKQFINSCNTFKTYQLRIPRNAMDTIFASLRMWNLKPDSLQYDEHRTDCVLFQWNDVKPQKYFKIWRWEKGWTSKAIEKQIIKLYDGTTKGIYQ